MNISAISHSGVIGRLMRLPLKLIPTNAVLPILQGRLKGKKWIAGSSNHGCWLGSYEHSKRIVFERTVTEGSTCFDVGAHVGFYTLLASELVGPKGRVFAFEPLPRNVAYLRRHLELNRTGNVTVFEAAVSDSAGQASFEEAESSLMGRLSPGGGLRVKTLALDGLLSKGEIPSPNFIKIDAEGAEMHVLTGAQRLLADARPTIFLATHSPELHRQCCDLLTSAGYSLDPIVGEDVQTCDEILATPSQG